MHQADVSGLVNSIRRLWPTVCHSRGTLAPEPANTAAFVTALSDQSLQALCTALVQCASGRERGNQMALVSWAAHCTKASLLQRVSESGIDCSPAGLFAAGTTLMEKGWDMTGRIAQLESNPADVEILRAEISQQESSERVKRTATTVADNPAPPATCVQSTDLRDEADRGFSLFGESLPSQGPLPARANTQRGSEGPATSNPSPDVESTVHEPFSRKLKLFGKQAAHTLEVGYHRRSKDFMDVQVVSVESASSKGDGTYDWGRKLVFQFTPEEMPVALAVLLSLRPAAKFSNHGQDHRKFLELRWQESGLVVITGDGRANFAVPVPHEMAYYLLMIFCTALTVDPIKSAAETIAFVRATFPDAS